MSTITRLTGIELGDIVHRLNIFVRLADAPDTETTITELGRILNDVAAHYEHTAFRSSLDGRDDVANEQDTFARILETIGQHLTLSARDIVQDQTRQARSSRPRKAKALAAIERNRQAAAARNLP